MENGRRSGNDYLLDRFPFISPGPPLVLFSPRVTRNSGSYRYSDDRRGGHDFGDRVHLPPSPFGDAILIGVEGDVISIRDVGSVSVLAFKAPFHWYGIVLCV